MQQNIMILAFVVFMIISFLMYTDYLNIFYEDRIHPLITELGSGFNKPVKNNDNQFVWTYLEEPEDLDKDINIQLLNKKKNFTILFSMCLQIMNNKINKKYNSFRVVSPENIKQYLPDFPIEMNSKSKYSLKFRVDLLSSMLLSKYGGLFLSPATLVMKSLDEIMYKLKYNYDLITFGGSERVINSCNNKNNPGNYVIAARKNNAVITLYRDQMLENLRKDNFINESTGEDLLANSISKVSDNKHFHFDCSYTGNTDIKNNMVKVKQFYGYEPIQFKDKDNIIFIALPYDIILENIEYQWFNNLSQDQFFDSKTQLAKIVLGEVTKIKK
tara:strand:+ start:221 stop:1207 length:987 start_codon:yes stop_codon:yes gene_type:complete